MPTPTDCTWEPVARWRIAWLEGDRGGPDKDHDALECTASVRIATEPVIEPAATLSRIRTEFEATDSAAVLVFSGGLPAPEVLRGVAIS